MKERFTTVDLIAVVEYLNRRLLGMRAANIYDIDHKTYLIKLARSEEKAMLLFESGCRIHTTEFDWPKNMMPSGFAMKLRKHLRTKRLVSVTQLGVDRVVDLQFGSSEHAHHLIIELYDRGNVILTDHAYTILSLLRVRTDADTDVRFAIRETFSMETIKMDQPVATKDQVLSILSSAKSGDQLKHVLNPHFVYGPALLSHCIIGAGLPENAKIGSQINPQNVSDMDLVLTILSEAFSLFQKLRCQPCKGYLIQRREIAPAVGIVNGEVPQASRLEEEGGGAGGKRELVTNVEFHPMLFRQHSSGPYQELETFNKAVDEFFSSKTSQKQDIKTHQMEKAALKKLENIQQDHQRRLQALKQTQDEDVYKAHLIELNTDLVEKACLVIRSAVASSMDWRDIDLLVREAQSRGDPVASTINSLKLQSNQITLLLKQSVDSDDEEETEDRLQGKKKSKKGVKGVKVDIDLSLSAYANAQKYYTQRRTAARKEQKTIDASKKALKSAEKKAKQSLKEAAVVSRIQKARKVLWFEKFYWFISSENYLVIGGRDQQQNELIVKKYLNDSDLYVHADLHGATSVVIRNPAGGPVPPKTLNEAGIMAVCYSSAWEAKIVTSAWWVYANQVSKTAPTGEYLTTGSFMIRGKKNFLPPCQLTLGFSVMFKLDETCVAHHLNERRVRGVDDDQSSVVSEIMSELTVGEEQEEEEEEKGGDITEMEGLDNQPLEDQEYGEEITNSNSDDGEGTGEDDDGGGEYGFLDTAIQIHQSRGGVKLEFQRSTSNTSSISNPSSSHLPEVSSLIGDVPSDQREGPDGENQNATKSVHRHLSAKERRMLKKKPKGDEGPTRPREGDKGSDQVKDSQREKKNAVTTTTTTVQNQYKRGRKSKQKKIKDKYWDQDEEEREIRMEILASSGAPKEAKDKKGKTKGKKKGDLGQTFNPKAKYHQKSREKNQPSFAGKQHKQQGPMFVQMKEAAEEGQLVEDEVMVVGEEDSHQQDVQMVTEDMKLIVQDIEALEREETADEIGPRGGDIPPVPPSSNTGSDALVTHLQPDISSSIDPSPSSNTSLLPSVAIDPSSSTSLLPSVAFGDVTCNQATDTSMRHPPEPPETASKPTVPTDSYDEESDEEEKKAILAEENILQLEESEKNSLIINTLTGSPLPNDLLLFAVPVCAPYSALHEYKFKVKLVPGTNRRGKAAKTAVFKFIQMKEALQLEKDLLRSIKDNDLSRYFPGKVKMTIPQQILRTKHK